jgi:excisionase family DNA binding protein
MIQDKQLETLIEKSVIKALEIYSSKQNTNPQKEYYTRKEVSELLNCSMSSIYNWTCKGKLTSYLIGNRVLYRVDEVHNSLIKL